MSADGDLNYAADRSKKHVRVPKGVRVKRVGKLNGLIVYTVNGEIVRLKLYDDFTMGGSGARYQWVPMNEIWLDKDLHAVDLTATLLHEFVEFEIMTRDGLSYDAAHELATEAEHKLRVKMAENPPKKIDLSMVRRQLGGR